MLIISLVLLLGVVAVSFASIFIKLCDAPALVIASYRLTFASLFFLAGSGLRRRNPFAAFGARSLRWAFVSGLFLSFHFATWITSLKYTSVTSSVVLLAISPIFVAVGSAVFLKEKVSGLVILGSLVTLGGVVVLGLQEHGYGPNALLGDGLAMCGALGAAGYFLTGRHVRARIDTLSYVTVVYSTTAVLLILFSALWGNDFFHYDTRTYVLFLLIAFVPQVIGHTSFNWALEHLSAATVNVVSLGEPVGASILAFAILDERITLLQGLGGILILGGVLMALRGDAAFRDPTRKPTRETEASLPQATG